MQRSFFHLFFIVIAERYGLCVYYGNIEVEKGALSQKCIVRRLENVMILIFIVLIHAWKRFDEFISKFMEIPKRKRIEIFKMGIGEEQALNLESSFVVAILTPLQ